MIPPREIVYLTLHAGEDVACPPPCSKRFFPWRPSPDAAGQFTITPICPRCNRLVVVTLCAHTA